MKKCWKCQNSKALDDFYNDRTRPDGKQPVCKVCQKARQIDPERRKEITRKYRLANAEKCKQATLKSIEKNPDRPKIWAKTNIEKVRAYKATNRAKRKNATGKYTAEQIKNLYGLQKGKCACCKIDLENKFHRDHIIPLVCGGSNDISNIQLLCNKCNLQKGAKDPIDFMQTRGFLL